MGKNELFAVYDSKLYKQNANATCSDGSDCVSRWHFLHVALADATCVIARRLLYDSVEVDVLDFAVVFFDEELAP